MRKLIPVSALILILMTTCLSTAEDSKNFIVSTNRAGNFVLGMSKEDVFSLCNKNQIKELIKEGEEDYYLELNIYLSENVGPSISLQMDSDCTKTCIVSSMVITDSKFVTSKGISVGSSILELSESYKIDEIYGVVESHIPCVAGKCEPIVYTTTLNNVGFILDSKEAKWSYGNQIKFGNIPRHTKISGIYLF